MTSLVARLLNVERLNHHLSHAYSTFFTSPFEEAAILIADGVGSVLDNATQLRETTSYAVARGNNINVIKKVTGTRTGENTTPNTPRIWQNSLGELFRAVTEIIGLDFYRQARRWA
jgi:carbamoyltransferase